MKVLRVIRIIVSLLCFSLIVGTIVDYSSTIPEIGSWLEHIQLMPAVLTLAMSIFICWMLATLIFGRIYCSSVCPLGVFQDITGRLGHLGKRRNYYYHSALRAIRYFCLFIVVVTAMLGLMTIPIFIDPNGIFSRFCYQIVKPVFGWLINEFDLTSPPVSIALGTLSGGIIAITVIILIGIISAKRGRLYCNSVCPVGTALGFVSRYSILHIDINTDLCTHCRKCEHVCKSECIDPVAHTVDGSRCVMCFNCVSVCSNKAIRYTYKRHQLAYPLMMKVGRQAPQCTLDAPDHHVNSSKSTQS